MKIAARLLRWPSLYELLSVCIATGALFISYLGYTVSRDSYSLSKENEEAQKENLLVRCGYARGKLQFIDTRSNGAIDAIVVGWRVQITDNSLAPVNVESTHIDISMVDGHDILGGTSYSEAKYGADHLLSDEGIYLAPGQSTSIGFDSAFPISPDAAAVDGVRDASTVFEANVVLLNAHFQMNLFGVKESDPRGSGGFESDKYEPFVQFTVKTSRGKTFTNSCSF
jgi:hypothetical protein